jgi:hypothetical protein
VTPAKQGKGKKTKAPNEPPAPTPAKSRVSMTWAQRLKRVFNIDIETCREFGGAVKAIACIEDPEVMEKILIHLNEKPPQPERACCQQKPGTAIRSCFKIAQLALYGVKNRLKMLIYFV